MKPTLDVVVFLTGLCISVLLVVFFQADVTQALDFDHAGKHTCSAMKWIYASLVSHVNLGQSDVHINACK